MGEKSKRGHVLFIAGRCVYRLLRHFSPSQAFLQPILRPSIQPAELNQGLDKLREPLVPQGAPDDSLCLRDIVPFLERNGVPVWVRDESVRRVDVVWLSVLHEVCTADVELLGGGEVRGGVEEGEEDTSR